MRSLALQTVRTPESAPAPTPVSDLSDDVSLTALCSVVLGSLPRSDQRRRGVQYVRGLLGAEGRKSIRNIATVVGGQATEQSLHHFIASSTWDWDPVRQALAQHLAHIAPPQAYVLRSMVIPKAGEHSVGVDRRFIPSLGQMLNAQQAVGVWSASADSSYPVNWRLRLPEAWLDDQPRRSQAAIPEGLDAESLGDCAVAAFQGTGDWGLPVRPVVVDAGETDAARLVRRLRALGAPLLVRIGGALPLVPIATLGAARGTEPVPAQQLIGTARDLRRPVVWSDHTTDGTPRTSLVAGLPVRLPGASTRGGRDPELLLLGVAAPGQRRPAELWLTDLRQATPAALLRLGTLLDRVDRDFSTVADQVGIRDFAGRSFSGWHRHVTLASTAHAVAMLRRSAGATDLRYAS
ncbi:IS701 family transposase [Kitasatospora sp. LaBMicrA B282]|uniref:IS701 family transposase n=1 Tax=Kitasatospora sp. LaBMicrA B282 TaxID=3420949 RepID=UPI003D0A3B6E